MPPASDGSGRNELDEPAYDRCENCGVLVDLSEDPLQIVVVREVSTDDFERTTLYFCSDDCLEAWRSPPKGG